MGGWRERSNQRFCKDEVFKGGSIGFEFARVSEREDKGGVQG